MMRMHWVAAESGIEFPGDRIDVEECTNKQGTTSFNAKVTYVGPMRLARQSLQRVTFDITQHDFSSMFHRRSTM
jgi:hypothetical protein